MVAALDELCKPDVELLDLGRLPVKNQFIAAGYDLQTGEIGTELLQDTIARSVDFNRINGFKYDGLFQTADCFSVFKITSLYRNRQ